MPVSPCLCARPGALCGIRLPPRGRPRPPDAGGSRRGGDGQHLWGIENVSGLVRPHRAAPGQRFDAEIGYGLGSRVLWYPYVAGDSTGQRRFGLKLSSGRTLSASLEFGRRESVGQEPVSAVLLRVEMRF